jgi:hypothetical protein
MTEDAPSGLSVREQRWPWLLTAGLMLASAAAAAWSTYLYWLPCRGEGTIIHPTDDDGGSYEDIGRFAFAFDTKMFACDRRMDGDDAPWTSELNIAATALLGVAWLALVLGIRWQLKTRAVAALPGLATLAVAAALAMDGGDQDGSVPVLLMLGIELSAAVALFAIMAWQRDIDVRRFLRLLVVLWGTTAFGAIHTIAEYVAMIIFSEGAWDIPPGTGYLTVATITISAILTVIMTLRAPERGADDEPGVDPRAGSLTRA